MGAGSGSGAGAGFDGAYHAPANVDNNVMQFNTYCV